MDRVAMTAIRYATSCRGLWQSSKNKANIRQVRSRIEQLTRQRENAFVGWEFDGDTVEINRDANRLQRVTFALALRYSWRQHCIPSRKTPICCGYPATVEPSASGSVIPT